MTFAFSLGNVTHLCLDLGITAWIAWLVGPAVDLSVVGLLTGMRFLSLHGYTDAQLARLRRMLRFCGLLTLALNTVGALGHRQFGTALVDAVGPALLIGWSDLGRGCCARSTPSARPPRLGSHLRTGSPKPRLSRPRSRLACWPGPGSWTSSTAWRPAGPSPGTPSAPGCGSAGTGPAPSSPPSGPKQPGLHRAQLPLLAAEPGCRYRSCPDRVGCP